jgi:four helix bundle protein
MRNDRENIIVSRTFGSSIQIIVFCELLESNRKYVVARQLLKSGTSIGANVREAQNAESKADFIHKMKISAKEADESEYWLILCDRAPTYPNCNEILLELKSIQKILTKIISSAKNN